MQTKAWFRVTEEELEADVFLLTEIEDFLFFFSSAVFMLKNFFCQMVGEIHHHSKQWLAERREKSIEADSNSS